MVAGCGNNMLKYILLFLNFLIFVISVVGVIVSLVFILKPDVFDEVAQKINKLNELSQILSPGTIHLGLYVILGASVIILVISFLGCCGAWKEIKFLLGLYAAVLLIILIAEIAAFVVAVMFKTKIDDELRGVMEKARTSNKTIYGDLEKMLECCGVKENDLCVNTDMKYDIDCYTKIVMLIKKFYTIVLAVSVITVVIEVLLVCFSCCLCSNIGEKVA